MTEAFQPGLNCAAANIARICCNPYRVRAPDDPHLVAGVRKVKTHGRNGNPDDFRDLAISLAQRGPLWALDLPSRQLNDFRKFSVGRIFPITRKKMQAQWMHLPCVC